MFKQLASFLGGVKLKQSKMLVPMILGICTLLTSTPHIFADSDDEKEITPLTRYDFRKKEFSTMSRILISIKPEYVNDILSGRKKYEYRKVKPKNPNITTMIIYSSFPVMKVVAEAEIEDIIEGEPNEVWEQTKDGSGTIKPLYDAYFKSRSIAIAYKLGKVKIYDTPKNLTEFGLKHAPQSYLYL